MTNPGLSMWNGSSKILYFMDFWHSFCWRLWRPWMLLSTKSKGHKSNFRISWMYRSCFYDLKVHFWWPNKCSKHQVLRLNTLYMGPFLNYVVSKLEILTFSNWGIFKNVGIIQDESTNNTLFEFTNDIPDDTPENDVSLNTISDEEIDVDDI